VIYVTLMSMKETIIDAISSILGRSGKIGRHSRYTQRERAKDKHRHINGDGRCRTVDACLRELHREEESKI